ncbi:MAG: PTS sugar transporter subunit IIA [Spirochaetia bacterium]|nr:PTS sugar transporter subunit IIA [Spirochaetia bacterium]
MGFIDYLLDNNSIECNLEAKDWEDAIIKGGCFLVEKKIATPGYLQTIVNKCRENGPYIVIAPGIAMPHARPEEGALGLGYALVTLKNGIEFGDEDNDPVRLMIYIAAPNVKAHNEEAVCQIADLCDDEETIEKIINAQTKEEIVSILKGVKI